MAKTAAQVAQKWQRAASVGGTNYVEGVASVTENPAAKAAAAVDTWQQRLMDPRSREKFVAGLQRTTLEDWKKASRDKGGNRYSSGITFGVAKFQRFIDRFLPHVQAVAERVRAMPKNSLDDRIARAVAQMRGNAEFRMS